MPNHCKNEITITGNVETIEKIKNTIVDYDNHENGFVPSFLEFLNPIGEWNYDKAVEEWGTKWPIYDVDDIVIEPERISFSFDTAWAPPLNAYEKGEERHNIKINARYIEHGTCFAGGYEDGADYDVDYNDNYQTWVKAPISF